VHQLSFDKLSPPHSNKYNDRINTMRIDNYTGISRSRIGWNRQLAQFWSYFHQEIESKDGSP
jgi:hypothetical protein